MIRFSEKASFLYILSIFFNRCAGHFKTTTGALLSLCVLCVIDK